MRMRVWKSKKPQSTKSSSSAVAEWMNHHQSLSAACASLPACERSNKKTSFWYLFGCLYLRSSPFFLPLSLALYVTLLFSHLSHTHTHLTSLSSKLKLFISRICISLTLISICSAKMCMFKNIFCVIFCSAHSTST